MDSSTVPEAAPTPEKRPLLEARAIEKTFPDGTQALDGVDLRVYPGETVALIGASGSGKTTLLRLFNRMTEPSAGSVLVAGKDVSALDPVPLRRSLGYVQQEGGLIPHWTVQRNVELVPRLLQWDAPRRRARAAEVLELVGLEADSHGRRFPSELSGGQRQRVALARSLAADPEVILLDEPFGALDALTRHTLQEQLAELEGHLRKTLLLVTHDLEEAFLLADRIAVLNRGKLCRIGTPHELEIDPGDDYVEALLSRRRASTRRSQPRLPAVGP